MTTTRIEQLEKKRDQLNARLTTERAKLQKKARKDDTRRKILIGGVFMSMAKEGENLTESQLLSILDQKLTRKKDRALFSLSE